MECEKRPVIKNVPFLCDGPDSVTNTR